MWRNDLGNAKHRTATSTTRTAVKTLHFSDLIFYEKDKEAQVRYLAGSPTVLSPLPEACRADAMALHKRCIQIYLDTNQMEFFVEYDDISYRVARMQTIDNIVYCLRRPLSPLPKIDEIGYPSPIVEIFKWLGRKEAKGLVLLAGSTGSGKSTTIYSVLHHYMITYGDILVSIEDPPETYMAPLLKNVPNCAWYQIDVKDYNGYENALKSTMRYNPRYIFLGEIREPSVAHWAIRAAINGHVVFSTIHASSPIGAIFSLLQVASSYAGSSPELARFVLAEGLSFVVYQAVKPTEGKFALTAETLLLEGDFGARSKIRSGKLEQLSSEIAAQKIIIDRGESLLKPKMKPGA